MTLLATHDDLAARLGISLTSEEQTRADALLATASDLVRASARQHITLVTDDEITIPGVWGDRILLPERPVVSVASVAVAFYDGTPVDLPAEGWYVDKDELVRYAFPLGLQRVFFTTGNGWLGPGYKLTITYTHGYDPEAATPDPRLALAKAITLESVVRAWVNPAAASQTIIGGVQEQYLGGAGMALTPDEEKRLADAFRLTAQSVNLR